jgi:hypothetical protein
VIDGGRLRLNSLTGAYSAGNAMMMLVMRLNMCLVRQKKNSRA